MKEIITTNLKMKTNIRKIILYEKEMIDLIKYLINYYNDIY